MTTKPTCWSYNNSEMGSCYKDVFLIIIYLTVKSESLYICSFALEIFAHSGFSYYYLVEQ